MIHSLASSSNRTPPFGHLSRSRNRAREDRSLAGQKENMHPAIPGPLSATCPGSPILTAAASPVTLREEEGGEDQACQGPKQPGFAPHRLVWGVQRAPRSQRWFSASSQERRIGSRGATQCYDEFSKIGLCGAMPRTRAVSNSAIESKSRVRK